jgi:hypothetical protein
VGRVRLLFSPRNESGALQLPRAHPFGGAGILDAIYCKPVKFRWQVLRIEVLREIRYVALRRNEVKEKAPTERTILQWARGAEPQPILVDVDEESKGRTQRQTMALKNVEYRIHAEIRPWQGFETNCPLWKRSFNGARNADSTSTIPTSAVASSPPSSSCADRTRPNRNPGRQT